MEATQRLALMESLTDLTVEFYACLTLKEPQGCQQIFYKIVFIIKQLIDLNVTYDMYFNFLEQKAGYRVAETGILITKIRNLFLDRKFLQSSLDEAMEFNNIQEGG